MAESWEAPDEHERSSRPHDSGGIDALRTTRWLAALLLLLSLVASVHAFAAKRYARLYPRIAIEVWSDALVVRRISGVDDAYYWDEFIGYAHVRGHLVLYVEGLDPFALPAKTPSDTLAAIEAELRRAGVKREAPRPKPSATATRMWGCTVLAWVGLIVVFLIVLNVFSR